MASAKMFIIDNDDDQLIFKTWVIGAKSSDEALTMVKQSETFADFNYTLETDVWFGLNIKEIHGVKTEKHGIISSIEDGLDY